MVLKLKSSDKSPHNSIMFENTDNLSYSCDNAVKNAYDILGTLTPLKADCGMLCGGACCKGGENDGMRLFPSEQTSFKTVKIAETEVYNKGINRKICTGKTGDNATVELCVCNGKCNRTMRPLACRIFPLFPLILKDGTITVAADARAYRLCPLVKNAENVKFDKSFVTAVRRAGRALYKNAECRDFLKRSTEEILLYQKLYGINIKISKRI